MDRTTASPITQNRADSTSKEIQHFKPYPEYKDSGVEWLGKIPVHWSVKSFKRIAKLIYGDSLPNENREFGEIEVYGSNGPVGFHSSANTRAPALIVGRKGSYGKVNFVDNPIFAIDTTYIIDERCTNENLRWLCYVLQLLGLDSYTEDSAIPGLAREFVYTKNVPYIPLSEQRAIANFLDRETAKIDALISKKERLIELLQEKRTALISQAVTKGLNPNVPMKDSGIEWLGKIPAHWEIVPLKYCTAKKPNAIKTGPFGSQLLFSEMLSGEIKVYNQRTVLDNDFMSGDNYITQNKFKQLMPFMVEPGDILITTRGTIGKCAIVPKDAEIGILHPCLMRIQPDTSKILPKYLVLLIQDSILFQTQIKLASNATTIDVIYSETMKEIRIPLPPIKEQFAIIDIIVHKASKIDAISIKIRKVIDFLKEFRTALISAAVTGKIDVRNVGAQHAVPLQES